MVVTTRTSSTSPIGSVGLVTEDIAIAALRRRRVPAGFEAGRVNDERPDHWNAAERAPQWVELQLAGPATVAAIDLVVVQDPPGPSPHELWIQTSDGEPTLVQRL